MPEEIERRFLIESGLDAAIARASRSERVEQGYVAIDPDSTQVRVRRIGERTLLTVKRGSGETRFEQELEIAPAAFEALWQLTAARRIEKRRHYVDAAERLTFELDVYEGALAGLAVVEVEFASAQESSAFRAPAWFGRELTGDDRYGNVRLAVDGLPA